MRRVICGILAAMFLAGQGICSTTVLPKSQFKTDSGFVVSSTEEQDMTQTGETIQNKIGASDSWFSKDIILPILEYAVLMGVGAYLGIQLYKSQTKSDDVNVNDGMVWMTGGALLGGYVGLQLIPEKK